MMKFTLNLFPLGLRKQPRDRCADGAPAAVGAVPRQLLQLDVQRCGQQDRSWKPGVPGQPLPAQQPSDRSDSVEGGLNHYE